MTLVGHFLFGKEQAMRQKSRHLSHAALIAALYLALSCLQNLLLPGSASWAVQLRVAEALCVLAFFTPAAISGLSLGCMMFNLFYAGALPMDFLVGGLATALSAAGMYTCRKLTVKDFPLLGMLLPALCNGLLVGWELAVYVGGGFWLNAVYVALGEGAALLVFGTALYYAMKTRRLQERLFS